MNMIDRVVITILFMSATIRPAEPSWLFAFAIVVVWLLWEGMVIAMYWKRKPLFGDEGSVDNKININKKEYNNENY